MVEMLRDPRYTVPLGILIGVILISAMLVNKQASAAGSNAPASEAASTEQMATVDSSTLPPSDVDLDGRRAADLAKLREAVSVYHARRGAYPSTRNEVVQLCAGASKPACALGSVLREDAASTDILPYWYASDGSTYAAFVSPASAARNTQDCPSNLPWLLASAPVMCVRLSAGDG